MPTIPHERASDVVFSISSVCFSLEKHSANLLAFSPMTGARARRSLSVGQIDSQSSSRASPKTFLGRQRSERPALLVRHADG